MIKHRNLGSMLQCMAALALCIGLISQPAFGQLPWMNTNLTPQARTELFVARDDPEPEDPADCNSSASQYGFVGLRIPIARAPHRGHPGSGHSDLPGDQWRQRRGGGDCVPEPTATGLPSAPLAAATFNPALNFAWGAIVGQETRNFAHQVLASVPP